MNILFVYRDQELGEALEIEFLEVENVTILHGDITTVACDAIVSPANSFGFMDGGLDYALSEKFGWGLQETLQKMIYSLPMGELLVGQALVVPTGDSVVPYLISAPTMRVPMSFNIATSLNAYLAMKAILVAAVAHPDIVTVAVPGLCTGVGKMPFEIAAHQMYIAYSEIILGNKAVFHDFGDAQKYHWHLNETGLIYD